MLRGLRNLPIAPRTGIEPAPRARRRTNKRPHARQTQPSRPRDKWTARESNPTTGMHGQLQPLPSSGIPPNRNSPQRHGRTARDKRNTASQTPECKTHRDTAQPQKHSDMRQHTHQWRCDNVASEDPTKTVGIPTKTAYPSFSKKRWEQHSRAKPEAQRPRVGCRGTLPRPRCLLYMQRWYMCSIVVWCIERLFDCGLACRVVFARVRSYLCAIALTSCLAVVPNACRALATVAIVVPGWATSLTSRSHVFYYVFCVAVRWLRHAE